MNKGVIIVIFCIISLNILLSGCIDNDSIASLSLQDIPPIILFDKKDDSLFVLTASKNINWSGIQIKSGEGDIPTTGYICAGDKIANCTGFLILVWTPSNTVIGKWDFNK